MKHPQFPIRQDRVNGVVIRADYSTRNDEWTVSVDHDPKCIRKTRAGAVYAMHVWTKRVEA